MKLILTFLKKKFKPQVEPVLFHGSALWGLTDHHQINFIQNRAIKFFLGVSKNSSNLATRGDLGWLSCINKQRLEAFRYLLRLNSMPKDRLISKVHSWSMQNGRSWESRVFKLARTLKLDSLIANIQGQGSTLSINEIKKVLHANDCSKWKHDIHDDSRNVENGNKLRTYRCYKSTLCCEPYVTCNIPRSFRRALAAFRCGSLPLAVEIGRFSKPKIPLHERLCEFCDRSEVEDELHFLIKCPFYNDIRKPLFQEAVSINPTFFNLCDVDRISFLMNTVSIQKLLAKTLHFMCYRRKGHITDTNIVSVL